MLATWLLAILIGAVLGLARTAGAEEPQAYVAVQAGGHLWPDRSNHDDLEADSDPGFSGGAAAGLIARRGDFSARLEIEAVHRVSAIHGRNSGGDHRSADGEDLHATALSLNLWPAWEFSPGWRLYAGGGGGGSWLQALDDDVIAPHWQAGGGVAYDLGERFSLDLGYRYYRVAERDLGGFGAGYDTHGPMIRAVVRFGP